MPRDLTPPFRRERRRAREAAAACTELGKRCRMLVSSGLFDTFRENLNSFGRRVTAIARRADHVSIFRLDRRLLPVADETSSPRVQESPHDACLLVQASGLNLEVTRV